VIALAVVLRNWRLGAGGAAALAMKLVLERVVKAVVERQRPASSVGDVVLRGRVSAHGLSFVSGHAVITVALAVLLTPLLSGRWRLVPWAVVAANAVARIYVGAHNPLDVLGGAGLGLFIGAVVNLVFDPPRGARRWHGAAPAVPTGPAVVVG
jgi:undecaprenyl-diphosphatase